MCVYVYIYTYACLIQVYSMDSVPLKMPQGAPQKVNEDIQVIVPDYLSILQETEVSVYVNMSVHNLYVHALVALFYKSTINSYLTILSQF